jgi:riboflavin synthase
MFTGIVEELGTLQRRVDLPGAALLTVRADVVTIDVKAGDSIAVNGACLTVVEAAADWFTADVMPR